MHFKHTHASTHAHTHTHTHTHTQSKVFRCRLAVTQSGIAGMRVCVGVGVYVCGCVWMCGLTGG